MSYPEAKDALLVLPFTPALLGGPAPLLSTVYEAAQHATDSLTVLFSSPAEQLYPKLQAAPRAHFDALQLFLGKVYAALAAGQWVAKRVLMNVEVRFDGEIGKWADKLPAVDTVVHLESHTELARDIIQDACPSAKRHAIAAPSLPAPSELPPAEPQPAYPVAAVGGTFDHLHAAHKLLLHMALFLSTKRLIAGVITPSLLKSKSNAALVEPLETRIANTRAFLQRCGSGDIVLDVVEIFDGLGPTAWDAECEALIVSRETMSGGTEVNRVRREKGLGTLDIYSVAVIASAVNENRNTNGFSTRDLSDADDAQLKELKMGSTAIREWMANQ